MGMPGPPDPALLNSRSSRPNVSLVLWKSARTASGWLISVATASISAPPGFAAAAVSSSFSARRPASTTEYPAACNARLTARPMPLPAPVTSAIFICLLQDRLRRLRRFLLVLALGVRALPHRPRLEEFFDHVRAAALRTLLRHGFAPRHEIALRPAVAAEERLPLF